MKAKMKLHKLLSLLLTLVMLLSLVPAMGVTASAAEPEWTTVNTYKELQDAVNGQKEYIKLGQNIDTTSYNEGIGLLKRDTLTFKYTGYHCTLDLNGKTLALRSSDANMFYGIHISLDAHLTIQDSSSAKTGKISGTFDNVLGGREAILINATDSTLTLEGGTFTVASKPYKENAIVIDSERSFVTIKDGVKLSQPEFFDEGYASNLDGMGYALKAKNRENGKGSVIIDGGEFDGCVKLTGSQAENGSVQINGGTFKKDVQLLYTAEENNSNPAVTVNGGTFEGNVYLQGWHLNTRLYMPYRLNGGTFKGTVDLYADESIYDNEKEAGSLNIALGLNECFGYSAIAKHDGVFTAGNIHNAIDWETRDLQYWVKYKMLLKGSNTNPVRIIPNAWGMKSVTLDGNPIDYFKDWKGTVENLTNDKAHTLKFEWYPLASELVNAGYTYRANFDCYTVGSNTPTTSVPISTTAAEYSHTIRAGEAPSVYPFDLQLNLEKNGNLVGIVHNQHIVKLVVNPAPVVTEISNAPVQLSAALTPDTTAPSAAAVGSGYTVDSINWYTDDECKTPASTFVAGTKYYGKIVLKPEKNYKFAASASAVPFCDDPNEDYAILGSSTVAEDGSSLTLVVYGTAVSALKWDSVDKTNQTYTIGDSALTLHAKAAGGDSGKPITYKLIAKKDGTETVKASATVAASATNNFSAYLSFTDKGSYECWFEATRGNVTITSDHFTVTVNAPGLSIVNQSGDLTVKQNATARLFVKAVGHGVSYQWQVKNDDSYLWDNISGATDYDYAAPTDEVGEKTYGCEVTDKYGAIEYTEDMKVTVTEAADSTITPAIPLAAVNGDAPDPAVLWPGKDVTPNGWLGLEAEYHVTAGETFHGVATFSTIPTGFKMNGRDIYYDSYNDVQKTPVLGTISYEWEGTTKNPWEATSGDFTSLGTDAHASFTIPSGVDTYYVVLRVKNTVGEVAATSTVNITFHVSEAHEHTYAYAQLNKDQHTKYCTAGDDSSTEGHDMENGVCKFCGYAPAKTYTVNVTNGSADPNADVTPGTKVTLTAHAATSEQEFDKWVGNVTVASDNTFTMPSHNVTVAATYKPIAHTHDTDKQTWAQFNNDVHSRSCTAGDDQQFEDHKVNSWTDKGDGTHTGTCSECGYVKTENHNWVFDHEDAPTFDTAGTRHYKCADNCGVANKEESIPKLNAISAVNVTVSAPIKDAVPGTATTTDTTYDVAATDWEPIVSGTFASGTKYTVKVSLEARDNNRFTNATTFQINGQKATIVGTQPTATGAEDTKITLTFPATEGGSTSGGSSGGGVTTYPITVKSAKNGDVTASHKSASKGTTVTLTVDPDKGYVLDTLTVLDGKDKELKLTEKKGKYTFTMPASKVTVKATFKAEQTTGKNPFIDVPAGSYYEDAVVWAVEKGITGGTSAVTFDPNGNCTRAQAVTFLWRAAGSPAPKTKVMPFTDVPSGSYYETAVLWAMEQGITKGTSDTAFSPNASCTRAQIVTFLWRANGSPAVSGNSAFTDVASDAYYAAAVTWAEKNDITGGIGNGLFGSNNNCTRAQIVTFLYRCLG